MSEVEATYLITGATGFLGRHIIQSLRKLVPEARVAVLVRSAAAWEREAWRDEAGDVDVIVGGLFDVDNWKNDPALSQLRGIFHLAGIVKHSQAGVDEMIRVNVDGTLNIVRLAAQQRARVVFASSSGTVGCSLNANETPNEDAPFSESSAKWPYYASKIRAEKESRKLADQLGAEFVVIRPPVMLGPKDHRFRSTAHVLRLVSGKLPFILPGEMHFVDVRDVADAMVRAMLLPNPRRAYNLPGHVMSLDNFFRLAAREANITPSWRTLPAGLLHVLATLNKKTLKLHALPDPVVIEMAQHHWNVSSRYASEIGFRARPREETLRDTVKWIRTR